MGTYLFFASGPRPNDRASRPRTIPIAAQLRKPSRTFVQSGFNEVALTPAIRATLCHATSQNPPDSHQVIVLQQAIHTQTHSPRPIPSQGVINLQPRFEVYPVHVTTRKSFGLMTRKLSVTESHRSAQFRGTFSRKKPSGASANWAQVA